MKHQISIQKILNTKIRAGEGFVLNNSNIFIQLPLGSLRTFDVMHSRLVMHFRILKKQKKKFFTFLILYKLNLLYIFNYFFFMLTQLSIS